MVTKINVDKDIRLAETLPAKFYKDENLFDISKKKIFLRSWHWIGDDTLLKEKNTIIPYNILPEFLDEPILVSCSADAKFSCLRKLLISQENVTIYTTFLYFLGIVYYLLVLLQVFISKIFLKQLTIESHFYHLIN